MTVTFAEIVPAPEQPYAETFIYNAIRKTLDQGQLELVKSGNRQPVPVTTRYYSRWQKKFFFTDTEDGSRKEFLAMKVYWLSGVLGGGEPVWIADPRDAQYLNTTPEDLAKMAAEQASAGFLALTPEGDFASATPKLLARAEEYHNRMQAALGHYQTGIQRGNAARPHEYVACFQVRKDQRPVPCSKGGALLSPASIRLTLRARKNLKEEETVSRRRKCRLRIGRIFVHHGHGASTPISLVPGCDGETATAPREGDGMLARFPA